MDKNDPHQRKASGKQYPRPVALTRARHLSMSTQPKPLLSPKASATSQHFNLSFASGSLAHMELINVLLQNDLYHLLPLLPENCTLHHLQAMKVEDLFNMLLRKGVTAEEEVRHFIENILPRCGVDSQQNEEEIDLERELSQLSLKGRIDSESQFQVESRSHRKPHFSPCPTSQTSGGTLSDNTSVHASTRALSSSTYAGSVSGAPSRLVLNMSEHFGGCRSSCPSGAASPQLLGHANAPRKSLEESSGGSTTSNNPYWSPPMWSMVGVRALQRTASISSGGDKPGSSGSHGSGSSSLAVVHRPKTSMSQRMCQRPLSLSLSSGGHGGQVDLMWLSPAPPRSSHQQSLASTPSIYSGCGAGGGMVPTIPGACQLGRGDKRANTFSEMPQPVTWSVTSSFHSSSRPSAGIIAGLDNSLPEHSSTTNLIRMKYSSHGQSAPNLAASLKDLSTQGNMKKKGGVESGIGDTSRVHSRPILAADLHNYSLSGDAQSYPTNPVHRSNTTMGNLSSVTHSSFPGHCKDFLSIQSSSNNSMGEFNSSISSNNSTDSAPQQRGGATLAPPSLAFHNEASSPSMNVSNLGSLQSACKSPTMLCGGSQLNPFMESYHSPSLNISIPMDSSPIPNTAAGVAGGKASNEGMYRNSPTPLSLHASSVPPHLRAELQKPNDPTRRWSFTSLFSSGYGTNPSSSSALSVSSQCSSKENLHSHHHGHVHGHAHQHHHHHLHSHGQPHNQHSHHHTPHAQISVPISSHSPASINSHPLVISASAGCAISTDSKSSSNSRQSAPTTTPWKEDASPKSATMESSPLPRESESPPVKHEYAKLHVASTTSMSSSYDSSNSYPSSPQPQTMAAIAENDGCPLSQSVGGASSLKTTPFRHQRSRSLSSPARSPGAYEQDIMILNHVYQERFPKATVQMEERLSKLIYDLENEDCQTWESVARFVKQQVLALAKDCLEKSKQQKITTCYFYELSEHLEKLLSDCRDRDENALLRVNELVNRVLYIIARPARLLECIEFNPNDFYRLLEAAEGQVKQKLEADVPKYIISKLGLDQDPLKDLNSPPGTFNPPGVQEDICVCSCHAIHPSASTNEMTESKSRTSLDFSVEHARLSDSPSASCAQCKCDEDKRKLSICSMSSEKPPDTRPVFHLPLGPPTKTRPLPTESDFEIIKHISNGAYGAVYLVRERHTRKRFALKKIRKQHLLLRNQVEQVFAERDILSFMDNPFVVTLYCTFETRKCLCMVMEYVEGGDCATLLKNISVFPEGLAKMYFEETVLALEYLHSYGIVHRDLKPDNLLITVEGHIKLTDFGLSKVGLLNLATHSYETTAEKDCKMFCDKQVYGTPEYIAPEVILRQGYGRPVDWWSMGIILYEFLVGCVPFSGDTADDLFTHILQGDIEWPEEEEFAVNSVARDLIEQLLLLDPMCRLGTGGGAQEVKEHPYFKTTDWNNILREKAAFVPQLDHEEDTSYFDPRVDRYQHHLNMEADDDSDRPQREENLCLGEEEPAHGRGSSSTSSVWGKGVSRRLSNISSSSSRLPAPSQSSTVDSHMFSSALSSSSDDNSPLGTPSSSFSKAFGKSFSGSVSSYPVHEDALFSSFTSCSPRFSRVVEQLSAYSSRSCANDSTVSPCLDHQLRWNKSNLNSDGSQNKCKLASESDMEPPCLCLDNFSSTSTDQESSMDEPFSIANSSPAVSEPKVSSTPAVEPLLDDVSTSSNIMEENTLTLTPAETLKLTSRLRAESSPSDGGVNLVVTAAVPIPEPSMSTQTSPAPVPATESDMQENPWQSQEKRHRLRRKKSQRRDDKAVASPSSRPHKSRHPSTSGEVANLGNSCIFESARNRPPVIIHRGVRGYGFTIRAIRVFYGQSRDFTLQHLVVDVDPSGPAYAAGLRRDDLLTHVNGEPVSGLSHLNVVNFIQQNPAPGTPLVLKAAPIHETFIRRDGPWRMPGRLTRRMPARHDKRPQESTAHSQVASSTTVGASSSPALLNLQVSHDRQPATPNTTLPSLSSHTGSKFSVSPVTSQPSYKPQPRPLLYIPTPFVSQTTPVCRSSSSVANSMRHQPTSPVVTSVSLNTRDVTSQNETLRRPRWNSSTVTSSVCDSGPAYPKSTAAAQHVTTSSSTNSALQMNSFNTNNIMSSSPSTSSASNSPPPPMPGNPIPLLISSHPPSSLVPANTSQHKRPIEQPLLRKLSEKQRQRQQQYMSQHQQAVQVFSSDALLHTSDKTRHSSTDSGCFVQYTTPGSSGPENSGSTGSSVELRSVSSQRFSVSRAEARPMSHGRLESQTPFSEK